MFTIDSIIEQKKFLMVKWSRETGLQITLKPVLDIRFI